VTFNLTFDPVEKDGSVVVVIDSGTCAHKFVNAPNTSANHTAGAIHRGHIRVMVQTL
jgi:hypothetical protein